MVTGFSPQWSFPNRVKGTRSSRFVRLNPIRSFDLFFSDDDDDDDDDDDGWLSCLNYVPLSTWMAVSAFCQREGFYEIHKGGACV